MQDRYLLRPAEEQAAYLADKLRILYPNLEFDKFEWIGNPNMHLVIDDLSCKSTDPAVTKAISTFESSCNGFIKVYSISQLTKTLEKSIRFLLDEQRQEKALLIFPGEGAETVKSVLSPNLLIDLPSVVVPAKRIKDPQSGKVLGTDLSWDKRILEDLVSEGEPHVFIVIDDVIDSGRTIIDLKRKIGSENVRWYAATPVAFSPLTHEGKESFPSSIEGYKKIFASVVLQGVTNPVPLNSLSSFVEGGKKTEKLVGKCLGYYVVPGNENDFINSLLQLRLLFGYN